MRMTVRALGLLVGLLLVGAVVEPHLVPTTSPSVAQGIFGDRLHPSATPLARAPLAQSGPPPAGSDAVAPTAVPPDPLPTEFALRCADPDEPIAPLAPNQVRTTATPITLYQPVPYSTGEFVAVSNTNEHGANLRVAPRALARILRVVPEGEVLETVGADLKVDRVFWAYVRDEDGTVGWIVSHMLTGVARVPGRAPLPYQGRGAAACATFTPTPSPIVPQIILTPGTPVPGGGDGDGGSGGGGGGGGGDDGGSRRPGLIGARWPEPGDDDGSLRIAR